MLWSLAQVAHLNFSNAALANLSQAMALMQIEVEDTHQFEASDPREIIIDSGLETMFLRESLVNNFEGDTDEYCGQNIHRSRGSCSECSLVRLVHTA